MFLQLDARAKVLAKDWPSCWNGGVESSRDRRRGASAGGQGAGTFCGVCLSMYVCLFVFLFVTTLSQSSEFVMIYEECARGRRCLLDRR